MSTYTWVPSRGTTGSYSGGPTTVYYYVSTTGSDSTGTGTQANPWATIDKARTAIRAAANPGDVVVTVADGTYYNTNVTFAAADSAASGHTVTYQSQTVGGARLIGGQLLTGWTLHSGSIYKVTLSSPIYTLYENGVRARSARLPKLNPGASYPCAFAPYFTTAGVNDSYTTLQYSPGDFNPAAWTLADIRMVVWSTLFSREVDWFTDTHGASARDTTAHTFTLDNVGVKFNTASGGVGARYFMQGPLELLTEAGEFCCTSNGAGGYTLYYWPRTAPISSQEIIGPTSQRVLSLVGTDSSTRTAGIVIDGFTLEGTDFDSWYRFGSVRDANPLNDYSYQAQNSNARNGILYMENVESCRVTRCHIKNSGFAGVYIREYGQSLEVSNNWIEHVGTSGIYVEGRAPGAGDILKNNLYAANIVKNFGELVGDGVGMRLNQSGGNTIRNFTVANGPRQGIVITGWTSVVPTSDMYCRNNTLSYTRISSVGQDSGDMGAITLEFFSRVGVQTLSQIIIDGVNAHSSVLDAAPNGVFFDNESDGQIASNVQVSNVQGALFRTNDSPAGTHTLTNCSFLANGNANPSFDSSLIQTSLIGAIGNPYA